jgi:nitrite reductase (NO-forming)
MTRATWHLRANAVVGAWLVAAALLALGHRLVPAAPLLLVHLLLLGAVSSAILLWSQHFADTLLRRPAPGGRAGLAVRLGVHCAGALAVVLGLAGSVDGLVTAGGVLVAAAALAQVGAIVVQSRAALPSRFGHAARYYVAAGLLLPLAVACGVVMARGDVTDEVHARLYVAHVGLALLGWVGLTVLGTLVVLWPTVLHARITPAHERAGRRALPVALLGLGLVAAGAASGVRPAVGLGALVVAIGTALTAGVMVAQARSTPPRTYAGWSLAASVAWLEVCTLAFGALVVAAPGWVAATDDVRVLVAPFAIGFAAQVLVGSLSYLMPVVLGGGPSTARRTGAELDRGAVLRVALLNGGLVLFAAPVPSAVRVLASFVVLAVLLAFLVLAGRAVLAARHPVAVYAPVEAAPVSRSGAAAVATGVLTLVVALGVAVDPAAAGIGASVPDATVAATGRTTTVAATGRTTTVAVRALDMRFSPARLEVPVGDRLVIDVTNEDDDVHELVVENGAGSGRLSPGAQGSVDVGVVGSGLDGWCPIAGHRQMGMTLTIVVTGAPAQSAEPPGHTEHDDAEPAASAADDLDLMATPEPAFVAREAALAPADPDRTTHRVTLTVQEVVREVAPGVTQRLWTFDGAAPGPVLRGHVGDRFEITLVNDGSIGHSIDFHAGALAPDDVMRTIQPGESLVYTFTATRSGIWMYHCSTMPMSMHIANGMFGAVIIDPPGLPDVDREYVLVQSELYLGAQGEVADAAKIAAGDRDLVVFNGYAHQYRDRPLPAVAGERVRFWLLDAGPNLPSAFHVVGGQFDTVYREGDWVLRAGGSTGTGGAQVLDLAPAQGGFVELTFPEAGTYPFVSHAMADAEAGALGRVLVTDD